MVIKNQRKAVALIAEKRKTAQLGRAIRTGCLLYTSDAADEL